MKETDAAYIAGLFDGEGHVIYKQYPKQRKGQKKAAYHNMGEPPNAHRHACMNIHIHVHRGKTRGMRTFNKQSNQE